MGRRHVSGYDGHRGPHGPAKVYKAALKELADRTIRNKGHRISRVRMGSGMLLT